MEKEFELVEGIVNAFWKREEEYRYGECEECSYRPSESFDEFLQNNFPEYIFKFDGDKWFIASKI